jgi:WD40 repeat protein
MKATFFSGMVGLLLLFVIIPGHAQQSVLTDPVVITPQNAGHMQPLARIGRGTAHHIDWHSSGEVVAFGGGYGVWLLDDAFEVITHFDHVPRTLDINWHPTDNRLATLHADGEAVSVSWDTEQSRYITRDDRLLPELAVPGTFERITMIWHMDDFMIQSNELWYDINLETGEQTRTTFDTPVFPVRTRSKQFNPEIGGYEPDEALTYDIILRHPESGDEIIIVENLPFPATRGAGGWPYVARAIHPEKSLAAVAVAGGIHIWSLETGERLATLETDSDVASVAWHPQGTMLAAGTLDGTVYFFSVRE